MEPRRHEAPQPVHSHYKFPSKGKVHDRQLRQVDKVTESELGLLQYGLTMLVSLFGKVDLML